jgi:hypothetical protein
MLFLVVVFAINRTMTGYHVSGLPLRSIVMKLKRRCSISICTGLGRTPANQGF